MYIKDEKTQFSMSVHFYLGVFYLFVVKILNVSFSLKFQRSKLLEFKVQEKVFKKEQFKTLS